MTNSFVFGVQVDCGLETRAVNTNQVYQPLTLPLMTFLLDVTQIHLELKIIHAEKRRLGETEANLSSSALKMHFNLNNFEVLFE